MAKKKAVTKKKAPSKKPEKEKAPVPSEMELLVAKLKPSQLRFLYLYLGAEDGRGWNNATISYLIAYDKWRPDILRKQTDGKYDPEYNTARTEGYKLLTIPDIQRLKHLILIEAGISPDTIKKRYSEFAFQNKYPAIAITATDRLAKIAGVVKDDGLKINVPEIERLTDVMQKLLTPKK